MTDPTRFDIPELGLYGKTSQEAAALLRNENSFARAMLRQRAAELQIGAAHNAPELPAPRRIAPQPRATGYAAPGVMAGVVRWVRRIFN